MAARHLVNDHPGQRVYRQRSWWFRGVEYVIQPGGMVRASIVSVRGAWADAEEPKEAAILAHAKAVQILSHRARPPGPVEEELVVQAKPAPTRRGCCGRCDGCGAAFARPGDTGCHPGSPAGYPSRCNEPGKVKRRRGCAGCARPYEPTPKAKPTPENQADFYGLPTDDDPDFIDPPLAPEKGDRKWTEAPRGISIPGSKPLSRRERRLHLKLYPWYGQRPKDRSECAQVPRPCPFVTCAMHLYLDVHPETAAIHLNFPHLDPLKLPVSCAMDVADRGGISLEELGIYMNVSLEGASQAVDKALAEARLKLADNDELAALARKDEWDLLLDRIMETAEASANSTNDDPEPSTP